MTGSQSATARHRSACSQYSLQHVHKLFSVSNDETIFLKIIFKMNVLLPPLGTKLSRNTFRASVLCFEAPIDIR